MKTGDKRDGPERASNATPALDIDADVGGRAMPVEAHISPQGDSANPYLTPPGSTPWRAAIMSSMSAGLTSAEIAACHDCDEALVLDLAAQLRRSGILPRAYGKREVMG